MSELQMPDHTVWCPECNGEGFVYVMESTPDMNEHPEDCLRCKSSGIIPEES